MFLYQYPHTQPPCIEVSSLHYSILVSHPSALETQKPQQAVDQFFKISSKLNTKIKEKRKLIMKLNLTTTRSLESIRRRETSWKVAGGTTSSSSGRRVFANTKIFPVAFSITFFFFFSITPLISCYLISDKLYNLSFTASILFKFFILFEGRQETLRIM